MNTTNNNSSPMLLMLYPEDSRSFKEQWNDFKYAYTVEDVRELLAKSLEACVCSNYVDFQEARERSNMAHFFGQLMAMLYAKYQKDIQQDERYRRFISSRSDDTTD